MTKKDIYIEKLRTLKDWDEYLKKESGLPGPRANLELLAAVVDLGGEHIFTKYLNYDLKRPDTNSKEVFLSLVGVMGLGKLVTLGKKEYLDTLKKYASDTRWRIREAVAMALQRIGDHDINLLIGKMKKWAIGNLYEKRAAIAGLCEPRLLKEVFVVNEVLDILNQVTEAIKEVKDRKSEEFRVFKKALSYCWSVAVVANSEEGKVGMSKWFRSQDKDIKSVMKENLKKNRLLKMDEMWVKASLKILE
jgi:hypothetical protein